MFEKFAERKSEAIKLISECIDYAERQKMPERAKSLNQLAEKIESLRYEIAIIGFMKRGKSTLLNTLLGRADTMLAPVRSTVCTAVITKYLDRSIHPEKKDVAIVHFLDGQAQEIPHEDLDFYINQKSNKENAKGIKFIEVFGDFPLVKSSVAIVDTPGRGSIHKEHDILGDEFLPYADAIILPQAANLPMDADERQFLSQLPDKEKRRIFVVLTKMDLADEKELLESEQFVKNQLSELGIKCHKIYRTAAWPVLEAKKNGLSGTELEQLERKWGIYDLERDLEKEIVKNSDLSEHIQEWLRQASEQIGLFLSSEKNKNEECLKLFNSDINELSRQIEQQKKDQKLFKETYEKHKRKMIMEWQRAVSRFINKTDNIKIKITDKLCAEVENEKLLGLWGNSSKISRKIKNLVLRELCEPTQELELRLEELVSGMYEDIDSDMDLLCRIPGKTSSKGIIAATALGVGGAGVGAVFGSGTVLTQVGAIGSSWAAVSAPMGAVAGQSGWAAFWGTEAYASAVGAQYGAVGTAISTTVTGIATMGGVLLGLIVVAKVAELCARTTQLKKIPDMVEEEMTIFQESMKSQLEAKFEQILTTIADQANEHIGNFKEKVEAIEESIAKNDPSLKASYEKDLAWLEGATRRHCEFKNRICLA